MRPLRMLVVCSMVAALFRPAPTSAQAVVWVKPTAPWSVTGRDDLAQLKRLASGVGWEFEPDAHATAELKRIGIRTLRCINVDPLPGRFDGAGRFVVGNPERLLWHLRACREVGANPHIIIAQGLHPDLCLKAEDVKERPAPMGLVPSGTYGPKDWVRFREYCRAAFEYVTVAQGFTDAEFEVGNEPDIGGAVCPIPPKPANGSRALYQAYLDLYRNVAIAARDFVRERPAVRLRLGGPALAWAFTFKFGDFNWAERFLRDCGRERLKLDFLGVHYYGNISSLDGAYPSLYPSFAEMLKTTLNARDRYTPGVPLSMTEWGASYHTSNDPVSVVNGNHVGAAWAAAFLDQMLQGGVDSALYLVTTDLRQPAKGGGYENIWGWPSLFVNPSIFGKSYPKAPFHVLDMVSRLEGTRVEATRGSETVNCFASADRGRKRVTLLLWNYGYRLPEGSVGVEGAIREPVTVRLREAGAFFGGAAVNMRRWQVSETVSNAYSLFQRGVPLDEQGTALRLVDSGTFAITDDTVDIGFALPPSSVSLLEVSAP